MSEQAAEATSTEGAEDQQEERESITLPHGDGAFGALMDALAPEEGTQAAAAGGAPADSAATGDGSAAPADQGTGGSAGVAGKEGDGTDGQPAVEGEGKPAADGDTGTGDAAKDGAVTEPGAGGDRPAEWTRDAAELIPAFGELSTQLEENVAKAYHAESLQEVQEEHEKYFEAIQVHPRMLVGQTVPSSKGPDEPDEVLRDEEDVKSWQEAIKTILVEEVRSRTQTLIEDNSEYLDTVHQSIELFQNNADLIPGTKDFDVELANKFTALMKDYELRDDDEKLLGYSVPVQPIINAVRTDLAAARAKEATAPPAAEPAKKAAASSADVAGQQPPPNPADAPQEGLQSKAGNSGDGEEDFTTLWNTLGLPNLRI